jgi:hypothetical protein
VKHAWPFWVCAGGLLIGAGFLLAEKFYGPAMLLCYVSGFVTVIAVLKELPK